MVRFASLLAPYMIRIAAGLMTSAGRKIVRGCAFRWRQKRQVPSHGKGTRWVMRAIVFDARVGGSVAMTFV